MSTETKKHIKVSDIDIAVHRKPIKNIHLAVYPPDGEVRLSAPEATEDEVLRLFAISKLSWLKKQIKAFREQEREKPREYVSGESHYYKGHKYLLQLCETAGRPRIELAGAKKMKMYVAAGATKEEKQALMQKWYRDNLKQRLPELIAKWEKVVGVSCDDWGVRRMRTKWGSCNREAKRIWLNLELAKKPLSCLEYIIVHELVHFHERNHNDHFNKLMDRFMPKWRHFRKELNSLPVRHEDWGY